MITMSIGVCAGLFYWLAWYKLAFWILIYAIVYGGLSVVRASLAQSGYAGDSGLTAVALIPVAWHIGGLAGYL